MKPPFNIPGDCKFFQDGADENNEDARSSDPNIKISWFEEQVDTFVSRRIISNYQVYGFRQNSYKEAAPSEQKKKSCDNISEVSDQKMIIFKRDDLSQNYFPDFLKELYNLSSEKLSNSIISGRQTVEATFDTMPCEVTEITQSKFNVSGCNDKDSKTYYDAADESAVISATKDDAQLSTLEIFIQHVLDTSLAKFKDEINKTIDTKLESLKIPNVDTCDSDLTYNPSAQTAVECSLPHPADCSVLELDKSIESVASNSIDACNDTRESSCTIFNLMQPEIRNLLFKPECMKNFQSESINIINNNILRKNIHESDNFENNESQNLVTDAVIFDRGTRSLELNKENNKDHEKTSSLHMELLMPSPDSSKALNVSLHHEIVDENIDCEEGSSENVVSEVIKKNSNPKLLTDMTKFMYIIFESFRRLKEENIGRRKDISTESEVGATFSKCGESCPIQVQENNIEEQQIDEQDVECFAKKQASTSDISRVASSAPVCVSNKSECPTPNNSTEFVNISQDDQSIITHIDHSCIVDTACNTFIDKLDSGSERLTPTSDEQLESQNSGYAIQRFVKDDKVYYKLSEPNKILENLKEQYLQNFSSIEQNINNPSDYNDKYKCQLKKKYLPQSNLLGNKLSSNFYCNIVAKSKSSLTEKEKSSDIKSIKRVSTKSSNIISMRHSLIRSRHRGSFKSSSKKIEVSLDSTIISLLDINVKNKSSWLRKLSKSGSSIEEDKSEEKGNLLKRLCFIKFAWGKRGDNLFHIIDRHLTNIYNAICLDFVTDDVYKSVLFISERLRSSDRKVKEEIMRRWVKICSRPLVREKKSFNLECLHQFWVQFRTKICHLARPPPNVPPGFFPALTYPSEENRLIKEQVIQKYAKDILEYISDPKLFKHNISVY